jgi:DNA sulfur modification protein DndD
MIIKEIVIENFRSYYGVNTIKLKDGLTIFIGDNGDGKTTFFEALEWLFDTSKQNLDYRLISRKRMAELPESESDFLRVSMTFDHDGKKTIEKSFAFTNNANDSIGVSDFQFKGFDESGSERIPIQGGALLDRCFDAAIRKYSLFKGEENLNVFKNSDALNYLIETFSNISQFDPYFTGKDDSRGFTDFAEYKSQKAFKKAMELDKNSSKQERQISSELEQLRKELFHVKQRLESNRKAQEIYSGKLTEIENSKEASELLTDINKRLSFSIGKKNKAENCVREDYSTQLLDEEWILCGYAKVFEGFQQKVSEFSKSKRKLERDEDKLKGKQELAKEISEGIIPLSPNVPDKISMQEMIDDEFCKVCGRPAKEGTDAHLFMTNKLSDLIKTQQPKESEGEKPLFPNNFLKQLEQKSHSLDNNLKYINSLLTIITDAIEFNEVRKKEANKIQESIDKEEEGKKKLLAQNDGLTEEQLKNAYENISNWWQNKSDAATKIVGLEIDKGTIDSKIKGLEEQYRNLAKNSVAETYGKIHDALDNIKNAFENAKEKNTQNFLTQLEEKANQYLERLNIDGFYGIIRIIKTSDGTAKIALQDQNDTIISSPNQALKTTMYMSVLFAVSDLTTLKRENDYPLIFDAPTSSFSPQKEVDFFKVINNIDKQCIIFTKSFLREDGIVDNTKIDSQKCTIYRMEKKRPFDSYDLSTIQSKITLIKY